METKKETIKKRDERVLTTVTKEKDMTATEKENSRVPYGLIGRSILDVVGAVGFLSLALVAPSIIQTVRILKKRHGGISRRYQSPAYAREVVRRLSDQKMIIVFQKDGETNMCLTDKGRRELLKYKLKEKSLEKKRWDKKWRLIIFDIEEKRRSARDRVRENMQSFGFVKLQDSVWVYPYECEQIVTLLKAEYKIGKEMLHIVACEIEEDAWLKKKFSL